MFWQFFGFAIIASAIVVNKFILQHVPLIFFVGMRMVLAGLILLGFTLKKSNHLSLRYMMQDWAMLFGSAFLIGFVPALLKAYALKNMIASKAAFIGSIDPFITALYSYLIFGERLNSKKLAGMIIGCIGAMVLFIPSMITTAGLVSFLSVSLPEIAGLSHVFLNRYGWILAQVLLKRDRYTPLELNGIVMLLGGIMGLATSLFVDDVTMLILPRSYSFIAACLYTILIGNVVGYTLYSYFLKKYSATLVSLAGFSVPVFVTFFGMLFLGEAITAELVIAAGIIFVGVYVFYQEEIQKLLQKTET